MKILFSPIGNTDPWRNDRDGAMLNIVRTYHPDIVTLFFTNSIWEGNDRITGQSQYDWDYIINQVSPNTEVRIETQSVEHPHDFDAYKDLFHGYLSRLENEFPEAEILLNVTSGTPQMETTLCLEYVTYSKNKKCIQVSTPIQKSNVGTKYAKPEDQEIDLEIVNDEESQYESRCKTINIISFRDAMLRAQLKELIHHYDYEGALALLNTIPRGFRNKKKVTKVLNEISDNIKLHVPFSEIQQKYKKEETQKALFHTILLKMKHQRGDVAETLIRTKSIAEYIAEKYLNHNYAGLIYYYNNKPCLNLDYDPEFIGKYKEYIAKANHHLKKEKKDNLLTFPMYRDILYLLEPESTVLKEMHKINNINGLRNKVAHNLDKLDLYQNKNERNIDEAVHAIENLLLLVFPEVNQQDLDYLVEFNTRMKEEV